MAITQMIKDPLKRCLKKSLLAEHVHMKWT